MKDDTKKKRGLLACFIIIIGILILGVGGFFLYEGIPDNKLEIKRVTYMVHSGDTPELYIYVITPESVKYYDIYPTSSGQYDWFAGELPPEDEYTLEEYDISEQAWTNMENVLKRVNFMNLPEEIKGGDAFDGSSRYIQVETADGKHISGGYIAGDGIGPTNTRFKRAVEAIGLAINNN
ncbi:MAG: hypothetical protein K5769_01590 [Pseudobutyrivibrio sp.]|nr:hypothetical protein [Pseudobutyrivibrio sp.]